jgi:hypothetical protein
MQEDRGHQRQAATVEPHLLVGPAADQHRTALPADPGMKVLEGSGPAAPNQPVGAVQDVRVDDGQQQRPVRRDQEMPEAFERGGEPGGDVAALKDDAHVVVDRAAERESAGSAHGPPRAAWNE